MATRHVEYKVETSRSDAEEVINYKYTKNKFVSKYISAKNVRKYSGSRKKRKSNLINFRDNHFEKQSLKQSQRKQCDTKYRKRNMIPKDFLTKTQINTDYLADTNFGFYHHLEHLLSLKQDIFLGKELYIKYWNDDSAKFKGILTCISNSGQYKLSNITYHGDKAYKNQHLSLGNDAYWFHMHCTKEIYLIDENDNDKHINIKNLFIDIMKLKIIKYFLFIVEFSFKENATTNDQDVEESPIRYLTKQYVDKMDENILSIQTYMIKSCPFILKMAKRFAYGAKQRDFEYLTKKTWKTNPTYFQPEELVQIVCSYKDSVIKYIQNQNEKEMIQKEEKEEKEKEEEIKLVSSSQAEFVDWDQREIAKYVKLTKEENRTV